MPDRPTGSLDPNGEPETSQRELDMQQAQLKRTELLKQQIAMCTPKRPTKRFGLVVADGHFLKFDAEGDFKAKKALQTSFIPTGKTVKAKVTGVKIAESDTVTVASIEIKGRVESSQSIREWLPFTPGG